MGSVNHSFQRKTFTPEEIKFRSSVTTVIRHFLGSEATKVFMGHVGYLPHLESFIPSSVQSGLYILSADENVSPQTFILSTLSVKLLFTQ